ncbi:MAG: flavin reductase [Planctomycetota bacterium]|nr:flavin reductase [Planctomycetota bacterium]
MARSFIPLDELALNIFHAWAEQWFLLAAGDLAAKDYNVMTVAWGSLGVIWNKPFAMILVRPQRHTYRFTEKYPTFTLCAFGPEQRDHLNLCGTRSGRDIDKIKACGWTPIAMSQVAAPGFDEAELILECRKIYFDDIKPERFLAPDIAGNYPAHDYHRFYFGEVLAAWGGERHRCRDSLHRV